MSWSTAIAATAGCIVVAAVAVAGAASSAVTPAADAASSMMTSPTTVAYTPHTHSAMNMQPYTHTTMHSSSQSKRLHSQAVLHSQQQQQRSHVDTSDPAPSTPPPSPSRFAWLFSNWFSKGGGTGAESRTEEQQSAVVAVASSELAVLPAFSNLQSGSSVAAASSSSSSLPFTQADIAMWLHEHRHEHTDWREMSFLPPQLPSSAAAVLFSSSQREQQLRPQSALARSTAHMRRSADAHSPRAFSRQDHPPVLPPIASSDDEEADASSAMLNLNDDDHLEVDPAHVAEDAHTELLLKALALAVAQLESNSSTIDAGSIAMYFPANISAVYRGAWSAQTEQEDQSFWSRLGFPASLSSPHLLTKPAGFESDEGVLMFVLRAYPTWRPPPIGDRFYAAHPLILPSTARFSYVEGEMVLRDGHYAGRNDRIFLLHGLYSSHDGLVRLFANHDEQRAVAAASEEGPEWLSTTNLQQYLLKDADQSAPSLAQQVFLAELSYELNRTRTEVFASHRQRDRDRYRQLHGEDRAVTILKIRQHQEIRHRLPPMTPAEAESIAQAQMDAEDAEEKAAKRYSQCRMSMVFQLAPLQGAAIHPDGTALYAVEEESSAPSPASSANPVPSKPLSMRPISFAVRSPLPPSVPSPSRPQSPAMPITFPIFASSVPSVSSSSAAASADDALMQRRLQVIERAVQQHQDQMHAAAASTQSQPSKGDRDASHVNEANTQPQRSHLAMNGFLFSNQTCSRTATTTTAAADSTAECDACNFKLRLHATVLEIQPFFSKALHYAYFQSAIAIAQLYLLRRQMNAATIAILQRVSVLTIVCQALSDIGFIVIHLITAVMFEPLFNAFIVTSVLQFILFQLFEILFVINIWNASHSTQAEQQQHPEQRYRLIKMVNLRFYFILLMLLLIVWVAPSMLLPIIFALNSLWVPQIALQAYLGVRRALRDEYINGMSVLRLLPFLYLYGCPANIVGHATTWRVPCLFLGWMLLQLSLLHSQKRWGARWMVPAFAIRFLPERYDYFREIPLTVLGPAAGRRGVGARSNAAAAAVSGVATAADAAAGVRLPPVPVAVPVSSIELTSLPSHGDSTHSSDKSLEERALNAVQLAMDSNGDAAAAAAAAPATTAPAAPDAASSSSSSASNASLPHVSIDVHPDSDGAATSSSSAAASSAVADAGSPSVAVAATSAAVADAAEEEEDENPCPICYGELSLDFSSGASNSPSLMLCPCDHLFHALCLRRWMEQQMKCPVCRAELPVEVDRDTEEEGEGEAEPEEQQSEAHEAQGLLQQQQQQHHLHADAHANV